MDKTKLDQSPKCDSTWESPQLVYDGRLEELVQGGGGKISSTGGDPGEMRKQQPTG